MKYQRQENFSSAIITCAKLRHPLEPRTRAVEVCRLADVKKNTRLVFRYQSCFAAVEKRALFFRSCGKTCVFLQPWKNARFSTAAKKAAWVRGYWGWGSTRKKLYKYAGVRRHRIWVFLKDTAAVVGYLYNKRVRSSRGERLFNHAASYACLGSATAHAVCDLPSSARARNQP